MNRLVMADNQKYKAHVYLDEKLYYVEGLSDDMFEKEGLEVVLNELGGEIIISGKYTDDTFCVRCLCQTKRVRAIELIEFIFGAYGIIKGDALYSEGRMRLTMLDMCMSEAGVSSNHAYFIQGIEKYYDETDIIYAKDYSIGNKDIIDNMNIYEKKEVPWAFVKTIDIAKEGEPLIIRSLENETGFEITASDDTYIMIGIRGEVYEIEKSKFEKTYYISDKKLDIFSNLFDFIPSVELIEGGEVVIIDETARLCYPKVGASIRATKLQNRTKVFGKNRDDYFIGNKDDYLAIRTDDYFDVYIIQNEVFMRTYEEKK